MQDARTQTGAGAERAAEKLLRKDGLVILARNWRGGGGELDLAALEGDDTLVFVEVKARHGPFRPDRAPVSTPQRRRIAKAARAFRARYGVRHLPFRYDLVTCRVDRDGGAPDLAWDKNYQETPR